MQHSGGAGQALDASRAHVHVPTFPFVGGGGRLATGYDEDGATDDNDEDDEYSGEIQVTIQMRVTQH